MKPAAALRAMHEGFSSRAAVLPAAVAYFGRETRLIPVMAGLVPTIHVFGTLRL
jgi:hypothetical protein